MDKQIKLNQKLQDSILLQKGSHVTPSNWKCYAILYRSIVNQRLWVKNGKENHNDTAKKVKKALI